MLLGRTKIDRGSAATVATDSLTGEVTQELVTKERRFCFGLLVFFFFFPLGQVRSVLCCEYVVFQINSCSHPGVELLFFY